MKNIFQLEPDTRIPKASYIISYPHLLSYFQSLDEITVSNFVCGAHMVYGWMPTILDLYPENSKSGLEAGAKTLSEAKAGTHLNDQQIIELSTLVNNSFVGASKLLHFVNPIIFPIWDSKIYRFIFDEKPHNYRVNDISKYREYVAQANDLILSSVFGPFHKSVNEKMGYDVSPMRAVEIIMFLNSN